MECKQLGVSKMSLFKRNNVNEDKENIIFNDSAKKKKERQLYKEKNIKSCISMDGIDPKPLSYMVINDHGMDCYVRTFYIHTMPKNVQFATTFAPLFEVGFLFTIFTKTLEELNLSTQSLISLGRNKGIELCSCYGVQPEAFLSNAPFNHIYSLGLNKSNLIKSTGIKLHVMDKYSLATIYHHTNSSFSHKKGIPAGRNTNTGEPMLYDPYDPSHDGYGVIFTGKTGTGKSATMKMYISRLYHQLYRFVSIDSDKKGGRGEFSLIAEKLSGVNYEIKNNSKHRINPFDIDKQLEWDEPTDTEYETLRLSDKISDLTHIVLSMICEEDEKIEFSMNKAIRHIVRNAISTLYEKKQIYDEKPATIYEKGEILVDGQLVDGWVKKSMPTLSDLYMQILSMKKMIWKILM